MDELEQDYNGDAIRHCAACDWCKSLESRNGGTFYFCMDESGGAFLEETDLCGWCTVSAEDEDAPGEW